MSRRFRVGILGATGLVGQRFLQLLNDHPWFRVTALAASEQSAGKRYGEAARWLLEGPMPGWAEETVVHEARIEAVDVDFVFSALDSAVAGPIELEFARAGVPVISNAAAHRMAEDVPLLLADVNPEHAAILPEQQRRRGFSRGFLVTNPNCSTAGLVTALKPLDDAFGVEAVSVVTIQAASGAGYPGIPAIDLLDNVVPHITGEEEKLEREPKKILGELAGTGIRPAELAVSAQVHRAPVIDGHMESVSVKLRRRATITEVTESLAEYVSAPQRVGLPSATPRPVLVRAEPDRPQTRLDRNAAGGMAVVVGRIRRCPVLDFRFSLLSHNTIRGAAGAAILNAEWLVSENLLQPREEPGGEARRTGARRRQPMFASERD